MGLNFEPEPDIVLRARYPEAIKDKINARDIMVGIVPTPGKFRKHVFDFTDGLRLIISREAHDEGTYLHFSASMNDVNTMPMPEFMQFVVEHVVRVTGGALSGMMEAEMSDGGVLHLVWNEGQKIINEMVGGLKANPKWN